MVITALVIGVLTWLHVFCAMGWFGGDLVLMVALDPKLGKLSPSAKRELVTRVFPGINTLEVGFAGATVTFGLLLAYAITGGNLAMLSPAGSWGFAVTVGATLALTAFLLEVTVHSPAVRRVIELARKTDGEKPSTIEPETSKYERRSELAETTIIALLFLAFTCMIAAGQL